MVTSSTLINPHADAAVAHPPHESFGFQQTLVMADCSGKTYHGPQYQPVL